jgi:hypothetical protein
VVAAGVGLLSFTPYVVGHLPTAGASVDPAVLHRLVLASAAVPHSGYAVSAARIGLPDVPQISETLDLLGQTTQLRVWWRAADAWRVDAIGLAGEKDTYRDAGGLMLWDSGERRVTRQLGEPVVRLARPSDLLPTELGRRLAAAAKPDELTPLGSRRVAGISAAGVRITPRSATTTVGHVDLWADPATGLPLRVDVTEKGKGYAAISTSFLEFSRKPPAASVVEFRPAADVQFDNIDAPDVAALIGTFSSFALPADAGGTPRSSSVGHAGGTFGSGFDAVATLVLPGRYLRRAQRALTGPPAEPLDRPYGIVTAVRGPLLNGLLVVPRNQPGYGYLLSGAVSLAELERIAAALVASGPESP